MSAARYEVDPHYDPDLQAALERGGEKALAVALVEECRCGHPRGEHMAATGALGSFAGTACNRCWSCGTFTALVAVSPSVEEGAGPELSAPTIEPSDARVGNFNGKESA